MSRWNNILTFDSGNADRAGVERFAIAMKVKLNKKAAEGRSGWNKPDECDIGTLRRMLADHVAKDDMVDIANFAMMIWNREHPKGSLSDGKE